MIDTSLRLRHLATVYLRWQVSLSAEVNENVNLGYGQGPGLLPVSGLGFGLGQLILKRVLVAY